MFGLDLESWSYIGSLTSGIVAAVVAGFAIYQLWGLREQIRISKDAIHKSEEAIEVSRQAMDVAKESADAAWAAVREATRTRIDERAPRITVIAEPAQWPPRITGAIQSMPGRNERRLFDAMMLHASFTPEAGKEFVFPQDERLFLWLTVRGVVINEGDVTARLALSGEGRFIEGSSSLLPGQEIKVPPIVHEDPVAGYVSYQYILRPGEAALFEWGRGHQMGQWAPVHETGYPPEAVARLSITDSAGQGVHDHVRIELLARPLEPVPNRTGHWRVRDEPNATVIVHPLHRAYPEGLMPEQLSVDSG